MSDEKVNGNKVFTLVKDTEPENANFSDCLGTIMEACKLLSEEGASIPNLIAALEITKIDIVNSGWEE